MRKIALFVIIITFLSIHMLLEVASAQRTMNLAEMGQLQAAISADGIESETLSILFHDEMEGGRAIAYSKEDYYLSSSRRHVWGGTLWVPEVQTLFSYTAYGKCEGELLQQWTGSVWGDSKKTEFVYDAARNNTEIVVREWAGSAWLDLERQLFSYDAHGNEIEWLWQYWEVTRWIDLQKRMTTYDVNGFPDSVVSQNWNSAEWRNLMRVDYLYNETGVLLEETGETWIGFWVPVYKDHYHYAANGDLLEKVTEVWNGATWEPFIRLVISYNGPYKPSEKLSQTSEGTDWHNDTRTVFTYDGTGNLSEEIFQEWESSAVWRNIERHYLEYDGAGNKVCETVQRWNNDEWINTQRIDHSYLGSSDVGRREYALPQSFTVGNYPNPFNPRTSIVLYLPRTSTVTVTIHEMTGRCVKTLLETRRLGRGEFSIIWDGTDNYNEAVASGIYFYRVATEERTLSGSCMLLR